MLFVVFFCFFLPFVSMIVVVEQQKRTEENKVEEKERVMKK
jgi:hypothetical protein